MPKHYKDIPVGQPISAEQLEQEVRAIQAETGGIKRFSQPKRAARTINRKAESPFVLKHGKNGEVWISKN